MKYTVFGKLWQAFLDLVDLEQLVISNASHFTYPLWPPPFAVDLVHWWGRSFDPLVIARPVWWKVTIWIDALFFGPFYLMAIYAFLRGLAILYRMGTNPAPFTHHILTNAEASNPEMAE